MSIEKSRKAFEKYMNPAQTGFSLQKYGNLSPKSWQGEYVSNAVEQRWLAWKEAIKWSENERKNNND